MNVSLRNQRSRFASHCLVVLNEVNKHIMPDHDSQLDKVIYSDEKQVLVACFPPRNMSVAFLLAHTIRSGMMSSQSLIVLQHSR